MKTLVLTSNEEVNDHIHNGVLRHFGEIDVRFDHARIDADIECNYITVGGYKDFKHKGLISHVTHLSYLFSIILKPLKAILN